MKLEQFKKELRIFLTQSETMSSVKRKSGAFKAFDYYEYKLKEEELEFKLAIRSFINKVLIERLIERPVVTNIANAIGNFSIRNAEELALAVNIIEEYCDVWVFSTLSINYYGLDVRFNNDIKELFSEYDEAHVSTDILLGNIVRAITNYCYISVKNVLPLASEKEKNLLVGIATICQDIHIHDHDSIHDLVLRCVKMKTAIVNELNSDIVANNPGGLTNAVNNMVPELGSAKAPNSSEKSEAYEDDINTSIHAKMISKIDKLNNMTPYIKDRTKFTDNLTKDTNLVIPIQQGDAVEITDNNDDEDFLGESDHKEDTVNTGICHTSNTNKLPNTSQLNLSKTIDKLPWSHGVVELPKILCLDVTTSPNNDIIVINLNNLEKQITLAKGDTLWFKDSDGNEVIDLTLLYDNTFVVKDYVNNDGVTVDFAHPVDLTDIVSTIIESATETKCIRMNARKLPNRSQTIPPKVDLPKTIEDSPRSYSEVVLPKVLALDIITQTHINMVNVRLHSISEFYPLTERDELRFKDSDGNKIVSIRLLSNRKMRVIDHKLNISIDRDIDVCDIEQLVVSIIESSTDTKCIRMGHMALQIISASEWEI